MSIFNIGDYVRSDNLTGIFELIPNREVPDWQETMKHLIELQSADLQLTGAYLRSRYTEDEPFDGDDYLRRLAKLLEFIIHCCHLYGISAEEFHRSYCERILRDRNDYQSEVIRAVEVNLDGRVTESLPWYLCIVVRSSIVDTYSLAPRPVAMEATLAGLIRHLDRLNLLISARNRYADQVYDTLLDILTYLGIGCYACDIQPDRLLEVFRMLIMDQRS